MEFTEIKEKLNTLKVKKQSNEELLKSRKQRLEEIKVETEEVLKSLSVCKEVATEVQKQLSVKIDTIVNLALATCFGDEYTFKLNYVSARGKTEVEFLLLQNGKEIDPKEQNGGGLVDVLCFALRIAIFNISHTDNIMIFDEPFKFVSKGLRDKVAELVHTLSDRIGIQIIEVTHVEELMDNSDKQFVIKKIKGVSNAEN
jgi:DNA repair exonuclease SbcCD ATPase subunit